MIVVLLLIFQSICRLCQRIVLHVHDRWINPENVRLLSEATESTGIKLTYFKRNKSKVQNNNNSEYFNKTQRVRKKNSDSTNSNGRFVETDCRFCANIPQGYCRHHLHLRELQVQRQKQQQGFWNPLAVQKNSAQEYRELRKINRELRDKILKNRSKGYEQPEP